MHSEAIHAAEYAYDNYLSKPYFGKALFNRLGIAVKLRTPFGTLYRPNHGLAHTLRTMHYIPVILEYYKKNGLKDADGRLLMPFDEITQDDIKRLQISMAFYVAGRKSDEGFTDNEKLYLEYRRLAADRLEAYVREKEMVGEGKLFSEEQLAEYADLIAKGWAAFEAYDPGKAKAEQWGCKNHILALLHSHAHSLDLYRCWWPKKAGDNMLNFSGRCSQFLTNRDTDSLALYAQHCILATGDKLTAYDKSTVITTPTSDGDLKFIRPLTGRLKKVGIKLTSDPMSLIFRKPYSRKQFYRCSTDVATCLDAIESAPKPKFLSDSLSEYSVSMEEALECAHSGNAVMRIVDAHTHDTGLRWDFEQIADPQDMRPTLFTKQKVVTNEQRRWLRDLFSSKAHKREYHPPVPQGERLKSSHGVEYEDYFDAQGELIAHPVSVPKMRGQRKETPYTKKASWSLLPSHGRVKHYQYRGLKHFLEALFGKTRRVGILANFHQMHKKGERFLFDRDVSSTSDFIGEDIRGFFWLGQLQESRKKGIFNAARHRPKRFETLKAQLEAFPGRHPQTELLIGAQTSAIKAIFAHKDNDFSCLMAKDAANRVKEDYGMSLPLLVIDGKKPAKAITKERLDNVVSRWKKRFYHKNPIARFFWRVFCFRIKAVVDRIVAFDDAQQRQAKFQEQYAAPSRTAPSEDQEPRLAPEVCPTFTAHREQAKRSTTQKPRWQILGRSPGFPPLERIKEEGRESPKITD